MKNSSPKTDYVCKQFLIRWEYSHLSWSFRGVAERKCNIRESRKYLHAKKYLTAEKLIILNKKREKKTRITVRNSGNSMNERRNGMKRLTERKEIEWRSDEAKWREEFMYVNARNTIDQTPYSCTCLEQCFVHWQFFFCHRISFPYSGASRNGIRFAITGK